MYMAQIGLFSLTTPSLLPRHITEKRRYVQGRSHVFLSKRLHQNKGGHHLFFLVSYSLDTVIYVINLCLVWVVFVYLFRFCMCLLKILV